MRFWQGNSTKFIALVLEDSAITWTSPIVACFVILNSHPAHLRKKTGEA